MQIFVNGESRQLQATDLAAALVELGRHGDHLATALNGRFVPARQRASQPLAKGDRLEILAPMQGG